MLVAIKTFGCLVNKSEEEKLKSRLIEQGFGLTWDCNRADICIINSCCITTSAAAKIRKEIRRVRRDNPTVELIFTGCYAKLLKNKAAGVVHQADKIIFNTDKTGVVEYLSAKYSASADLHKKSFDRQFNTRKFLKIQDGCREFCAYCIVPYVRTKLWSRPVEDILEQIDRWTAEEYKEIVLTGIHLGNYGKEQSSGINFLELLKRIEQASPNCRIRLSSVEPQDVTEELIELIATSQTFCNQIYLTVQSGSNRVLERMGRDYRGEDLLRIKQNCQKFSQEIFLNADLMVGFPGERENDFEQTMEIAKSLQLARAHIFRYSDRPGTVASSLDDRVEDRVSKQRSRRLHKLLELLAQRQALKLIGREVEIIAEYQDDSGCWFGYSEQYLPARLPGTARRGELIRGTVEAVEQQQLLVRRN